jgi:acyl carrier protein phosphodiesterase
LNFLAHLSLSERNEDLMIGNFIADAVRSSQWSQYNSTIVKGIQLHHKIDFYTDNHPVVERSKKLLRPNHAKYTPVVVDILYDHFLAKNYNDFYETELGQFASETYAMLKRRWDDLPEAIQHMLPYMERGNWLVNYGNEQGLARVFNGMSRRANFKNQMQDATEDLREYYEDLEEHFSNFYPKLMAYTKDELNNL